MFNEFGEKEAVARLGGIPDIVPTMDGVFTVSGALRFLVLQLVLVIFIPIVLLVILLKGQTDLIITF